MGGVVSHDEVAADPPAWSLSRSERPLSHTPH